VVPARPALLRMRPGIGSSAPPSGSTGTAPPPQAITRSHRHHHVGFDLIARRPHHDAPYVPAAELARRPGLLVSSMIDLGAANHVAVGERAVRAWTRMDRAAWGHPSGLREQGPRVVHVHARGSTELARIAQLLHGSATPVVLHLHEVDAHPVLRTPTARRYRAVPDLGSRLLTQARLVVVPDPSQVDTARQLGAREVVAALPAPLPLAHGLAPSPQRPAPWLWGRRVVVVGPLIRERVRPLVEALAAQPPDTDLVLLGDGPDHAQIAEIADGLVLGHRVHVDPRPTWEAVEAHLWHADVVASASDVTDDTPVLLRAMALGRPVLATDVGERRHLVSGGVDGILVAPRDPWSLAGGLRRLLTDAPLAAALGDAGARRVAARSWSDVAGEILAALAAQGEGGDQP
jgi:glycosyltransferase involved in cell wall biosynthesis